MNSSFLCSMHDALEAGPDRLCDDLLALGVTGVTVAATYHAARDVRPRGRAGRLIDLPAGAHYMPALAEYPRETPPWTPPPFAEADLLAALREATAARGMTLTAWTVFGFSERLGRAAPALCRQDVYGDRATSDLCPAIPAVRAYALALVADVARRAPDALLAESLHHAPLRVTRRFVPLDARARIALGLCFCADCADAAHAADVEVAAVRAWARAAADAALEGRIADDPAPVGRDELDAEAGGALGAYLAVRAATVTSLVAAVSARLAAADVELRVLDQAAAEERALGRGPVDEAYRDGVDVAAVARSCGAYGVLGYAPDPAAVAHALEDYRAAIGGACSLRVALRPAWPDCTSTDNLAAKLAAAAAAGADGVDFYHYGLVSSDGLDRVRAALGALL